jgi:hypothetical protein
VTLHSLDTAIVGNMSCRAALNEIDCVANDPELEDDLPIRQCVDRNACSGPDAVYQLG